MRQQTLLASIVLSSILSGSLCADGQGSSSDECCDMSPRPMRLTARHIEANGVGYNQGYTTLEGFFSPSDVSQWVPFLDLRGHVFNDGKLAANAGLGARYIDSARVWGANVYYDYRDTHRHHYNQVSAGLECLGKVWDVRVNGYLPVGTTQSGFYQTQFGKFSGNSLFVSRKREVALKGINAEIGVHVKTPLYFAAGPYYLEGHGKSAWGGEVRAVIDWGDYFRIEGNASYDSLFEWIGQGQVSLILPFGPKRSVRKNCNCCPTALALSKRALQRVDRNEIIPVIHKRKFSKVAGLDFIFVNSNSHSDGTWQSPYPTLQLAQQNSDPGDIIYVFPGNGSPYDVSDISGFTMQDSQKLWGSSIPHTVTTPFGTITIPALSVAMPVAASNAGNVVNMGTNNEVAGMGILGSGSVTAGINFTNSGSSSIDLSLLYNQISVSGSASPLTGILITYTGSGALNASLQNNQITSVASSTAAGGISVEATSGTLTAILSNNQISNVTAAASTLAFTPGIFVAGGINATVSATLIGNQISNISGSGNPATIFAGIVLEQESTGAFSVTAQNNQISSINSPQKSVGILTVNAINTGSTNVALQDNQISDLTSTGLTAQGIVAQAGQPFNSLVISDNTINQVTGAVDATLFIPNAGVLVLSQANGTFPSATVQGNSISSINSTAANSVCEGIRIWAQTGNITTTVTDNQVSSVATPNGFKSIGINALNNGGAAVTLTATIEDNQVSTITSMSNAFGITTATSNFPLGSGGGTNVLSIQDNQVSGVSAPAQDGINMVNGVGVAANTCLSLLDNTAPPGIDLVNTAGTFKVSAIAGNTPTPVPTGTITYTPCP